MQNDAINGLNFLSNVEARMEKGKVIIIIINAPIFKITALNRIAVREKANEIKIMHVKDRDYRDEIRDVISRQKLLRGRISCTVVRANNVQYISIAKKCEQNVQKISQKSKA